VRRRDRNRVSLWRWDGAGFCATAAVKPKGGTRVQKTDQTCQTKRVRAATSPGPVHTALRRECPSAVCTQFEAAWPQRASTRSAGTGRCRWAVHSGAGVSWEPFRAGKDVRTLGGRTRDPATNAWIRPSTSHKQSTGQWLPGMVQRRLRQRRGPISRTQLQNRDRQDLEAPVHRRRWRRHGRMHSRLGSSGTLTLWVVHLDLVAREATDEARQAHPPTTIAARGVVWHAAEEGKKYRRRQRCDSQPSMQSRGHCPSTCNVL